MKGTRPSRARAMGWCVVVAGMLMGAGASRAHEDARGPHGGLVKEFGGHHIEGVLSGGMVKVYLLDQAGGKAATAATTGGSITVLGGGAPAVTKIPGGSFSEGSAPVTGTKAVVTVTLTIDGKPQSAKFRFN